MLATATFFFPKTALMTLDLPTFGYPTKPTWIFSFLNSLVYNSTRWIRSETERISGELMYLWMVVFSLLYRVVSDWLSASVKFALIYCIAEKKMWSIPLFVKYSFHILIFYALTKSLLLTKRSDFLVSLTSFTYTSKSSLLKNNGSLPSTIWITNSVLSTTLQSCFQTSMFFS